MARSQPPIFEVHRNQDGRCLCDGQDWPCPAVPGTLAGYDDARDYGQSQRLGQSWLDGLPSGLQIYSRVIEPTSASG